MSQWTKRKALDKLARVNVKIGYPDKWQDYSGLDVRPDDLVGNIEAALKFAWLMKVKRLHSQLDRSEWDTSPQTVNASYDDNLNEMILPGRDVPTPLLRSWSRSGSKLRSHGRSNRSRGPPKAWSPSDHFDGKRFFNPTLPKDFAPSRRSTLKSQ